MIAFKDQRGVLAEPSEGHGTEGESTGKAVRRAGVIHRVTIHDYWAWERHHHMELIKLT